MLARFRPALLVWLLLAALPAAASASAYSTVESAYASTGAVPACEFSSPELAAALKQAPTYDLEYFGDLTAAINTALSERAGGECTRHTRVAGPGPAPTGPLANLRPPLSATAATGADLPLPLLLALLIAAAAGLIWLGLSGVRLAGWDPTLAQRARHSWAEAEDRLSGTWADFQDWLRF